MKRLVIILLTCILSNSAIGKGLVDNRENRLAEAHRYLEATPPSELMDDMTKNMSLNLPDEKRRELTDMMTKHLDMVALNQLIVDSMVKHFTADELKALADFYGSPIGKSAMKKFGIYMGDIMPGIQLEVRKAYIKTMEEKKSKKRDLRS